MEYSSFFNFVGEFFAKKLLYLLQSNKHNKNKLHKKVLHNNYYKLIKVLHNNYSRLIKVLRNKQGLFQRGFKIFWDKKN